MALATRPQNLRLAPREHLPYLVPLLLWMLVMGVFSTDVGSSQRTTTPIIRAVHRLITHKTQMPPAELDQDSELTRKPAHILEYAILGFLVARWLLSCFAAPRARLLLIAIAIAVCYASADELHQHFDPSRTGAVRDVLFDAAGAIIGTAIFVSRESQQRAERREGQVHPTLPPNGT